MTAFSAAMLDIIIGLIILVSGLLSWTRGLIEELVTILAWVVGLVVAIQFASVGAQFIPEVFDEINLAGRTYGLTPFHPPIAGILLFLITFVLVSQLYRIFAQMAKDGKVVRSGDRAMGFLFGLLRGGLVVLVLVLIAGTTVVPKYDFWQESALIPYFVEISSHVIAWMPENWQEEFYYPPAEEPLLAEDIPLPDEMPSSDDAPLPQE